MSLLDIAKRLKNARESKNISVYKLSQISGVSETHIRDLERGTRNPSFDTLSRLVKPLGLSLADIFKESTSTGGSPLNFLINTFFNFNLVFISF